MRALLLSIAACVAVLCAAYLANAEQVNPRDTSTWSPTSERLFQRERGQGCPGGCPGGHCPLSGGRGETFTVQGNVNLVPAPTPAANPAAANAAADDKTYWIALGAILLVLAGGAGIVQFRRRMSAASV